MTTETKTIELSGLLWVIMFVCMYLTGNCGVCGGDRDYIGDYIDGKAAKK